LREPHRHHRRRQQVIVDGEARHQRAGDVDAVRAGDVGGRCAETTGHHRHARFIEQRELGELGEVEHEVLEDAVLLPALQAGLLKVGGDGVEDLDAAGDVELDLFGDAPGDVQVAVDDGLLRAAADRQDRHRTVGEQRQHRRSGHQEREACRDLLHCTEADCTGAEPADQRQKDDIGSRPGSCTTLELASDDSRAFVPGEEDGRGIVHEHALQSRGRRADRRFVHRRSQRLELAFGFGVVIAEDVESFIGACGPPEEIRSHEAGPADHIDQNRLELSLSDAGQILVDGDGFELHVDADVIQLALNLETEPLEQRELHRDQAREAQARIGNTAVVAGGALVKSGSFQQRDGRRRIVHESLNRVVDRPVLRPDRTGRWRRVTLQRTLDQRVAIDPEIERAPNRRRIKRRLVQLECEDELVPVRKRKGLDVGARDEFD
jgi:hypothetical protein